MATYVYRCNKCEKQFEVEQKMTDDALIIHDMSADLEANNCGGDLVKVFSPVGIVWKGSGFYKTDARGSSGTKPGTKSENKTDSKTDVKPKSEKSSTKSATKSPAKEAKATKTE